MKHSSSDPLVAVGRVDFVDSHRSATSQMSRDCVSPCEGYVCEALFDANESNTM